MKMVKSSQFSPMGFGDLIEDFFGGNHSRFFRDDAATEDAARYWYQVPVNVVETDQNFTLSVVAPGVSKEDIKLQVNNKELTISFEHQQSEKQEGEKWLRKEFKLRSFKRSFTLGDKIDDEKIDAAYNNGILTVTLPKKETAIVANKMIEIK